MRYGAIISGALHVLIVILVIVGLPDLLKSDRPDMTPISVEIVTLDEKAQQREPQEKAKPEPPRPKVTQKPAPAPEPKPEPPKQTARETPPPAPVAPPPPLKVPEPEPMPAAKPVPKPEAKPAPPPPEPDPAPQPRAKPVPPKPAPPEKPEKTVAAAAPETPAPKPRRKPEPPPDEFQALLKNLAKEKRKQVEEKKAEAPAAPARPAPSPARSALQTQMAAASLAQAVMRQVSPCWNIPAGAKDAANMSVDIRIRLNPDGALGGQPRIEDSGRLGRDPFFRAVAESALRALRNPRCMPLKLPYDQYDLWKEITFVFDPSTALGQ